MTCKENGSDSLILHAKDENDRSGALVHNEVSETEDTPCPCVRGKT